MIGNTNRSNSGGPAMARRLSLICAAVIVLFAAGGQVGIESAFAGTYVMRSCNVPGEASAPRGPWFWEYAANTAAVDQCADGGGFGFQLPGAQQIPRSAAAALTIVRPAGSGISIRKARLWMDTRLSSSGSALFVGTSTGNEAGVATGQSIFGPPGGSTSMNPFVSDLLPTDAYVFRLMLYCSSSSSDDCFPQDRYPLELHGAEVTLEEREPPTVSFSGGDLLDGQAQQGTKIVRYLALDNASGIKSVEVLLAGRVVAQQDFSDECSYTSYSPCSVRRAAELSVNTATADDGTHALSLRVMDAAGNPGVVKFPAPVTIRNSGSAPTNPALATTSRVSASFVTTGRKSAIVRFGGRVGIRGYLALANGERVPGGEIEVRGASDGQIIGRAKTDSDGRFRLRTDPLRRSRSLTVEHVGATGSRSSKLRVKVRATSTLSVLLRGRTVRYRGRILAQPLPRAGKMIVMQGRRMGGAWQSFAVRRVKGDGDFAGSYRLRVRRPGVRLQFRVFIPTESGYGFARGHSPSVIRVVR